MGFSSEWEQCYSENTHMSIWPWSDIVSLVYRHCNAVISSGDGRVLELGCGAGANIQLFLTLGMDYHGIEGSPTIVKHLHQKYPGHVDKIVNGDFTSDQPFEGNFDLVIDRASLTHNDTLSIERSLTIVLTSLKAGGIFIGSDWFSTNHSDSLMGSIVDQYTVKDILDGSFANVGNVHFSDESHLRNLFSKFEILFMEEKLVRRYQPQDQHQFASWNIVARKPSG